MSSWHDTLEYIKWNRALRTLEAVVLLLESKKGCRSAAGHVNQEITRLKLEAEIQGVTL